MDPIIRAAAVTTARRTLGRPGSTQVPLPVETIVPAAPVPVVEEVPAAPPPALAPAPTPAGMEAEAAAALARARAVLEEAEARRREWEAQEAAARARLDGMRADLERRERALQAAQRTHEEAVRAHEAALQDAHDAAARRGYEDGLARGSAAGRDDAAAAAAARLAQLDDLARALADASADALGRHEDMLVDVAWTAICRLAGELAVSREGALAMVRSAAAQVRDAQALHIRLHPQDAAWLAGHAADSRWTLRGDPAVALGGCIVESAQGTLDARLELQLERLRGALRAARAQRGTAAGEA
ncbi:flagellar assembly protein FliH [Massilia sp. PDC64]|nr:FliH/SctL family protein [Massilia sp. PDC64]SDF64091.1 flagellar assembly protein FliH [Massilia sp. PDC64]